MIFFSHPKAVKYDENEKNPYFRQPLDSKRPKQKKLKQKQEKFIHLAHKYV